MPLQNRVTPFGAFEAVPSRGTLMGNRGGALHDAQRRIGARRWTNKRWIACALTFKGRRRSVMAPGRYTELFFLDEVTALAAGHRPCFECRRLDFLRFATAWNRARDDLSERRTRVKAIDDVLHADRWDGAGPRRWPARLGTLPDGTMVSLPETPETAWLVWEGQLHRWSHEGYGAVCEMEASTIVTALTPRAAVAALAAGYRPAVHDSLDLTAPRVRAPAPA